MLLLSIHCSVQIYNTVYIMAGAQLYSGMVYMAVSMWTCVVCVYSSKICQYFQVRMPTDIPCCSVEDRSHLVNGVVHGIAANQPTTLNNPLNIRQRGDLYL